MSGVKKSEKKISSTEYFKRFEKMNDEITKFILMDFGVKHSIRDLRVFLNNAKFEDPREYNVMEYLCKEYGIQTEANAPLWFIERMRDQALDCLDKMEENITLANTVYVEYMSDYTDRRRYMWIAQAQCYRLERIMTKMKKVLPVKYKRCMYYIGLCTKEIELIKEWRAGDKRKVLPIVQRNEAKLLAERKEILQETLAEFKKYVEKTNQELAEKLREDARRYRAKNGGNNFKKKPTGDKVKKIKDKSPSSQTDKSSAVTKSDSSETK